MPGPVLEVRAESKLKTGPYPHGVHILVRGGGKKVASGSSIQAPPRLHAMEKSDPSPNSGKILVRESVVCVHAMVTAVLGSVFRVLWRLLQGEHGMGGEPWRCKMKDGPQARREAQEGGLRL